MAASVFQFGRILKPSNSALDFLWKILVPKLPSMSFASLSVFETALRSDVVRFDLVDINDFDASNTDQNLFQYFIAALYNTASILKKYLFCLVSLPFVDSPLISVDRQEEPSS